MDFDLRGFRDALGCFPTGVTVVIASDADETPRGMTVNSFTSVSLDPPLVLWCLNRRSNRRSIFSEAGTYTINLLAAEHETISSDLARRGSHSLANVALVPTSLGPPALAQALAVFECERESVRDGGDHDILIGRVVRFAKRTEGAPLVFFQGRYGGLAPFR